MIPNFLLAAAMGKANGYYSLPTTLARTAHAITNNSGIDGDLRITGAGQVQWDGDLGNTDVDSEWWTPINTVKGSWHAQLVYVSGNNFYLNGTALSSYRDLDVESPQWNFYKNTWGTGGGTGDGVYRLDLSNDGGSTAYGSCTITITMAEESL